jgi:O-antigen/teichoic acid export membrane protein
MPHNRRLLQNVSAEAGARVFYLVTRFFIPPFVLARVGMEAYGLYGTVFVLVAYFGMSAIGFSSAYIKYVAEFAANGENARANRLLSSGFTLMSAIGILGFGAFLASWTRIETWIKVPDPLRSDARSLGLLVIGTFFAYLALSVFRDTLTGLQEIAVIQRVWILSFLVETGLIFALVGNGWGLLGLGISFSVRTFIELAAHYRLATQRVPWLRIRWVRPDRDSLRLLLNFGGIVQLNAMLSIFLNSVERVIATPLLGLTASGLLDLGKRFPAMATSIPSSFASSVLPAAAELHAGGANNESVSDLYLRTARLMNVVSGLLFSFLACFSTLCLSVWLGKLPEGAAILVVLFALSSHVHLLTGPGTSILKAIGKPKMEFHYSLANVAALAVIVPFVPHTVTGIAAGCVAATTISAGWFLARAHAEMGVSQRRYAMDVLFPGLVPYATGLILLPLTPAGAGRGESLLALTILGPVFLILAAAGLYGACASAGEQQAIRQAGNRLPFCGLPAEIRQPSL